jgi:transcriptional regulator with XRE-family HTH domain
MIAESALTAYPSRVSSFGENLRTEREAVGLTQEALAARLGLKRPSPVSIMESFRGGKVPRASQIRKIAEALGVAPAKLLDGVETELDRLRGGPNLSQAAGTTVSTKKGGAPDVPASARDSEYKSLRRVEASLDKVLSDVRQRLSEIAKDAGQRGRKRG